MITFKLRKRQRILRNFRRAREHRSVPMQLADFVVHKWKLNVNWDYYYLFGFYRRDLPWSEKALYVNFGGSYYFPWEGNSLKYDRLFIRKSLQKAVLVAEGLATPRLLMKVGLQYAINTEEAFAAELGKIDRPFITKFDGGGSGVLNLAFEPDNGKFRCGESLVGAHWIWQQYQAVVKIGFLVEERVVNHPVLAEIYPTSLNTLRLNTVKTADGEWHQLRPIIKFGSGGSHIDNTAAGGLFAGIDESGRIETAHTADGKSVDSHPDTQSLIRGKAVPYYQEALELALRASKVFGFMSSIGWDIGITSDGPTIIEGNPAWDPEIYQEKLGPFLSPEVAAGLIPRRWWTPWDKTHMYPNYMKYVDGGLWQRFLARRRQRLLLRLRE